jgi:hypothetical protein
MSTSINDEELSDFSKKIFFVFLKSQCFSWELAILGNAKNNSIHFLEFNRLDGCEENLYTFNRLSCLQWNKFDISNEFKGTISVA